MIMTTLLSEDRTADQQFEILLSLQLRSGRSSETDSRLRSSATALVTDILLSKLNAEADLLAPELMHVRGFCDMERALVACRALQVAFEGFCQVTQAAGVSLVVDSGPRDVLTAGQSPSTAQIELLGSARPFQVLVAQAFYDKLQRRQPVALRSFRQHGSGVCEFLWTRDQRLAELQGRNELMRTVVIPVPQPTDTGDINDRTMLMSVDDTFQHDIEPPVFGGLTSGAEIEARGGRRRSWIVMSSAAALLGILCYLGLAYTVPGSQLKQQAVVYLNGVDAPAPAAPPRPPPPFPDVPHSPAPPPPPPPPPKKTPNHPCEIGKTLVPDYLNLANDSLNKGEFQDAIRQYTKVLDCDPGNATARDGVQRARRTQAQEGKT